MILYMEFTYSFYTAVKQYASALYLPEAQECRFIVLVIQYCFNTIEYKSELEFF